MPNKPIICLDAGHGGSDPGRQGTIRDEKNLNLELSMILRDLLSADYELVMTRSEDVYMKLLDRCHIANAAGADLFISLHHNGFHLPSANGFEVLHWHTSIKGKQLAELIIEHFELVSQRFGVRIRGAKPRKNLTVLRRTRMPAVIVEAGFISNPDEEHILNNRDYQRELARTIRKSISDYFGSSL